MVFDITNYQPLEYLNYLEDRTHLILLYDKPQYRDIVQYRFIKNGLTKGEHCIFLTHGDTKLIEEQMKDEDIDVDRYKQENLLHIHQIENIMNHPKGIITGFQELMQRAVDDLKPPFHFVARVIPDVSTKRGMETEVKIEHFLHTNFSRYECSFLCPYNLVEMENTKQKFWLNRLFEDHHGVIYATKPENAVAFDVDLV